MPADRGYTPPHDRQDAPGLKALLLEPIDCAFDIALLVSAEAEVRVAALTVPAQIDHQHGIAMLIQSRCEFDEFAVELFNAAAVFTVLFSF